MLELLGEVEHRVFEMAEMGGLLARRDEAEQICNLLIALRHMTK